MVEVARLESVYRFIAYPGFESPSLRQDTNAKATFEWLFALETVTALHFHGCCQKVGRNSHLQQ